VDIEKKMQDITLILRPENSPLDCPIIHTTGVILDRPICRRHTLSVLITELTKHPGKSPNFGEKFDRGPG
jgi:hypothetical protein